MPRPDLPENHRRAVGIALARLDELLCAIESWADGRQARGVLYSEINDLPRRRREAFRKRAAEVRTLITEARGRLSLEATEIRASGDIWSRCSAMRDTLSELGAKHMKGYGELPPSLASYMNDLSARLVEAIDQLSQEGGSDG